MPEVITPLSMVEEESVSGLTKLICPFPVLSGFCLSLISCVYSRP